MSKMSNFDFILDDIIYEGRGDSTHGTPLAKLYGLGYFDIKCKTHTDIKTRLAELLEALNTLTAEGIYDAAYDLCGYSHFALEYKGKSLPSNKTDLFNYKRGFEGTEHWPAFIQGMKTALLRQRLAELKEEVYTHTRNMFNTEVLKMNHINMRTLRANCAAIHESVDALTLENIATA